MDASSEAGTIGTDGRSGFKDSYLRHLALRWAFIACLVASIVCISAWAMTIGARDISFLDVFGIILDHLSGVAHAPGSPAFYDDYAVWELRLPRVVMAVIAGASLAIGGAAMQTVVRNPLADPYTTGISSGAVFGVSVALVLGISLGSSWGRLEIVGNAFLFGLIPVAVIVAVMRLRNSSPATLILCGIAMTYMFSALSTLLLVTADAAKIQEAYLWQIGSLDGARGGARAHLFGGVHVPTDVALLLIVTLIGTSFMMLSARKFNLLAMGDEGAKSMGLDAESFRVLVLIALSVMTASVVGFFGVIGFVGLVSPHIVRLVLGGDNRFVVPASALFGAAFLLAADGAARVLSTGGVPVGVVMSFVGGPLFLLLILRSKRDVW